MTTHQLFDQDGTLCFYGPKEYPCEDGTHMLFYRYPAGDIDTLPWPMVSRFRDDATLKKHLAHAIFDEVEMGNIPQRHGEFTVLLPDGSEFPYLDYIS